MKSQIFHKLQKKINRQHRIILQLTEEIKKYEKDRKDINALIKKIDQHIFLR